MINTFNGLIRFTAAERCRSMLNGIFFGVNRSHKHWASYSLLYFIHTVSVLKSQAHVLWQPICQSVWARDSLNFEPIVMTFWYEQLYFWHVCFHLKVATINSVTIIVSYEQVKLIQAYFKGSKFGLYITVLSIEVKVEFLFILCSRL